MLLPAKTNFEAFCIILNQYRAAQKPSASMVLFKAERLAALIRKILHLPATGYQINVLSIIRDPRAVISSQMVTNIPGTEHMMATEPVRAAAYWRNHIRSLSKSGDSNQLLRIRYEDLIRKNPQTIIEIGNYLDVDLSEADPASGDLLSRLPLSHLDIHKNVTGEPKPEKIDKWRNTLSLRHIYLIQRICRSGMKRSGYPILGIRIDPYAEIILIGKLITYYLQQIWKKLKYHIRFKLNVHPEKSN
jgi:hypothetical protein